MQQGEIASGKKEVKYFKEAIASPENLLGDGYGVTRIDGDYVPEGEQIPFEFKVTSVGDNNEGEQTKQGQFFYLAGAREGDFPTDSNVGTIVGLYESADGERKYIGVSIDN